MLLLSAVALGIVVPLCLWEEEPRVLVTTPPPMLRGKVQVQGDSHFLVHIQEGIATQGLTKSYN